MKIERLCCSDQGYHIIKRFWKRSHRGTKEDTSIYLKIVSNVNQSEGYPYLYIRNPYFSPFSFFQWLGIILFTGIVAGNLLRKKEEIEANSIILENVK